MTVSVIPWAPAGIASPQFESHAAFDPWNGDLYFVRSSPEFRGWRILVSHVQADGWSPPQAPPFAGNGVEADPWFTPDGRSLYFISTRTEPGAQPGSLDIWRVDRAGSRDQPGAWGTPQRLPAPVNSSGNEWFPRLAPDGCLYFGSDRPGGLGKTDIWRARQGADGQWTLENAGPAINTPGQDYEATFSPDGSRMVIMSDGGLYESRRGADGAWLPRVKLPDGVNTNGTEIGAVFSPSGRSLLFSRDTQGPGSGEFFVWRIDGDEDWPPTRQALSRPAVGLGTETVAGPGGQMIKVMRTRQPGALPLLMMPSPPAGMSPWTALIDAIGRERGMVAYEALGAEAQNELALSQMADSLLPHRMVLVTHGAQVDGAVRFAQAHAARLAGLLLIDPPNLPPTEAAWAGWEGMVMVLASSAEGPAATGVAALNERRAGSADLQTLEPGAGDWLAAAQASALEMAVRRFVARVEHKR